MHSHRVYRCHASPIFTASDSSVYKEAFSVASQRNVHSRSCNALGRPSEIGRSKILLWSKLGDDQASHCRIETMLDAASVCASRYARKLAVIVQAIMCDAIDRLLA